MAKHVPMEITLENPLEHPAVKAWGQLGPERVEPAKIEILRGGAHEAGKRTVYRLEGVGPAGAAIIAKRSRQGPALVERTVYQEILPHLPVSGLRYYGWVEEPGGLFAWLFLEDAGGERYSPGNAVHRALVTGWLGLMHTSAASVVAATRLPERGPPYYLELLRAVRGALRQHRNAPALGAGTRATLEGIVSGLDALESRWNQVEACCEGIPATLVHGDFRPKNVHVRADPEGTILLPMDWEMAGWGVPAADLAPAGRLAAGPQVDATDYWFVVRDCWPGVALRDVRRLVAAGTILRRLAILYWDSLYLAYERVEKVLAALNLDHAQMAEAVEAAFGAEGGRRGPEEAGRMPGSCQEACRD
jgi:Phosphotransferase enzyme family